MQSHAGNSSPSWGSRGYVLSFIDRNINIRMSHLVLSPRLRATDCSDKCIYELGMNPEPETSWLQTRAATINQ